MSEIVEIVNGVAVLLIGLGVMVLLIRIGSYFVRVGGVGNV